MSEKKFYLYGKIPDKFLREGIKENDLVIYTLSEIFNDIPVSSLEGIFVSDESDLDITKRLSWLIPQVYFKSQNKEEIEKKYFGKFIPFK